jgi:hypothetical protein
MNKKEITRLCAIHDAISGQLDALVDEIIGIENKIWYQKALDLKDIAFIRTVLPSLEERFELLPQDHYVREVMIRMINQLRGIIKFGFDISTGETK